MTAPWSRRWRRLCAVAQAEDLGKIGAAIGVEGGELPRPADRDIDGAGVNDVGAVGINTGNLIASGSSAFAYDSYSQLSAYIVGSTNANLSYDALGRLVLVGAENVRLDYDGDTMIGEYVNGGGLLRRYLHGPGSDEPMIWYESTGVGDRRYLDADERGSIVRITDGSGNLIATNSYDPSGIPASTNQGRFQYTGQSWIPSLGMYYYKARMYSPTLGRFIQTDPIGYGDGLNWYNYVKGDPVNGSDPSGLSGGTAEIVVNAIPCQNGCYTGQGARDFLRDSQHNFDIERAGKDNEKEDTPKNDEIVVNGRKPTRGTVTKGPVHIGQSIVCYGSTCLTVPATPADPPKPPPCPNFSGSSFFVDTAKGAVGGLAKSIRAAEFAALIASDGASLGQVAITVAKGAALGAAANLAKQCLK